jgi:crotonobetainyl-CoA:carnitine CoA-transferase CaiB-like acyl-CoA transferase
MPAKPNLPERRTFAQAEPRALDGLLVIDFTRVVAGPSCTQTLADFGAHVIKIENPTGGDDSRAFDQADAAGESAAYISLNRNKLGMALDLGTQAARQIAGELIAKADVVVENFTSGVMKKFGLDYASMSATNPRLVYCSISAYGREGPFALRPGFDPITQAESGFMSLNGFPDSPPVRTQPPIIDLATGMSACNAILLALLARDRLGHGQHVEVALYDTAVAMTTYYSTAYLISGENPGRFGNSPNGNPTVDVFEASDGPLYLASPNDRQIRRLLGEVFEQPELLSDPRFESRASRMQNREALRQTVAAAFRQRTLAHWMARLKEVGVPAGYLRTVEQGLNAPETQERNLLSKIPHPTAGWVPNIEPPIRMTRTPAIDPVAAPLLGQHTKQVLRETLGYDDARLAALAEAGAFGAKR